MSQRLSLRRGGAQRPRPRPPGASPAITLKSTRPPTATAIVPITGPIRVPKIAAASTDPSTSPRASGRSRRDDPGQRAAPDAAGGDALHDSQPVQPASVTAKPKAVRAVAKISSPIERRPPDTDPGRQPAADEGPRDQAGGVRRGEDPDLGLRGARRSAA